MPTPAWRRYLRFWRPDPAADVDDELRTHLELRAAELRAHGLAAGEAERRALAEFGDVAATRQRLVAIDRRIVRRRARFLWWDALRADVRYAVRGLVTSPLFTAAAVITLAVGIGAATTMYGLMRRLLVQPPPGVAAPERVARLYFHFRAGEAPPRTVSVSSYPLYELLRDEARTLAGVAGWAEQEVPVDAGAEAAVAHAVVTTAGFWRTLGARPALGRFFTDDEADPVTGARVVVLGHEYWQRRFGGDASAVGATLRLKGRPYEVIGVAPAGFRGVGMRGAELWLPAVAYADGDPLERDWHRMAGDGRLDFVARLRPDANRAQADAELSRLLDAFGRAESRPAGLRVADEMRLTVSAAPVTGALGHDMQRLPEATVVLWLVGVAVGLLLIACANVAGLLLLRALRRRREIAVRMALGMSRRRLVALLLTARLPLASRGGIAATMVVIWGGAWVRAVLLPDLGVEPPPFDASVAGAFALCILGTALLAGFAPVLQLRRGTPGALRDGVAHTSTRHAPLHRALLVGQTALSAVLLVGAGLFVRSLQRVTAVDLGLDAERVLAVSVHFAGTGRSGREIAAFYERALERTLSLPGVERATVALSTPLRWSRAGSLRLTPDGEKLRPHDQSSYVNYVTDAFFATTGTRVVAGRGFLPGDRDGAPVAVVNERFASAVWPGRSPLGECVYPTGATACATVVGLVADERTLGEERVRARFYRPLPRGESLAGGGVLLVRVAPGAASRMSGTVRRALHALEPNLPYVDVGTLASALDPQLRPWRLGATLFTAFGLLAALLAAVGLYAAIAYAVAQRTHEIGVRRAVGAGTTSVVWLVLRDGLGVAAAGVAIGLLLALAGPPRIADLLYEVSPHDGRVLTAVAATLLAVALLATLVPAWRAVRVSPTTALRVE